MDFNGKVIIISGSGGGIGDILNVDGGQFMRV